MQIFSPLLCANQAWAKASTNPNSHISPGLWRSFYGYQIHLKLPQANKYQHGTPPPRYQERCHPAPALRCVGSSPQQYQISLFHDPKTTIAISQSLTKRLSLIGQYSQRKLGIFEVFFWP
jgi:hypothetical protein